MSCKSKDIIPDLFLIKPDRIRHHLGLGSYILNIWGYLLQGENKLIQHL